MQRPVAVTIFGILNIGFGAMGLLGAFMSGMFENMGAMASNPQLNSIVAFMETLHKDPGYILWQKISMPLEIAACLILMAAGVGLLRLKSWGRLTSIGYAVYKILFSIIVVFVLYHALHGLLEETLRQASGPVRAALMVGTPLVGGVALVLSLAYPALLLFFLTRPKIVAAFAPRDLVTTSPL
jgi:hypothetical protein